MMQPPELSLAMSSVSRSVWLGMLAPREQIKACAAGVLSAGGRHLTLDVTANGFRPRELDRSARRDLVATFNRDEVLLSGLDCLVPAEHLRDREKLDRAVAAISAAIELAADMRVRRVACRLPSEPDPQAVELLRAAAERQGVVLAAYGPPAGLAVGAIPRTDDPGTLASELAGAEAVRWGWPVGVGGADAATLVPMLATLNFAGEVDLDLTGAGDPQREIDRAFDAWFAGGGRGRESA